MEAPVALDPQKAMFQPTAGKVILKFLDDETRQLRIKFGQVIQEPGQVLLWAHRFGRGPLFNLCE